MPFIAKARISMSLARQNAAQKNSLTRYAQCTYTENEIYNTILQQRLEGKTRKTEIIDTIVDTATETIPQKPHKPKQD